VKAHVEEDLTGSRLTYAEKKGVERSKERRNGRRLFFEILSSKIRSYQASLEREGAREGT